MPGKHTSSGPSSLKRPQCEKTAPLTDLTPIFHSQLHQDHYTCLSQCHSGKSRDIDWDVLCEVGLEDKVRQMLSAGAWR